MAFRTVAVGDRALLGKWLWFDDLGGWVYAGDTGISCKSLGRARKKFGCVARNQVDVFVGGSEMHSRALRMGIMEWEGRIQ